MTTNSVNHNFYGMASFSDNPLSIETKTKLSRLLFLNTKISAEEARTISRTYLFEEFTNSLLERLQMQIDTAEPLDRLCDFLDKIDDWVSINGLLTYDEVVDASDNIGMPESHLINRLRRAFYKIEQPSKEMCIALLRLCSNQLDEDEVNTILDLYLTQAT